jgi:hypothetical protein
MWRRCRPAEFGKTRAGPLSLAEGHILERAAKEKRTFFRDADSDRLDPFDGGDFVVGQVFCAEAAGEFAPSKQTSDHSPSGNKSRCDFAFHFSFDSGKQVELGDNRWSRDGNCTF